MKLFNFRKLFKKNYLERAVEKHYPDSFLFMLKRKPKEIKKYKFVGRLSDDKEMEEYLNRRIIQDDISQKMNKTPCEFKDIKTGKPLSDNCKLKHLKEGKK